MTDPAAAVEPSADRRGNRRGNQLRALFVVAALGFAGWAVAKNWSAISEALPGIRWLPAGLALACAAAGTWAALPAWRLILAGLGSTLALVPAGRVFFVGQLGKYVPGAVWTVVAQTSLARDLGVPRSRSGAAGIVSILIGLITAGLLGFTLIFSSAELLRRYWWALLLCAPLVALLHPAVMDRLIRLAATITRRAVTIERIPARSLLTAAAVQGVGQFLLGLHLYFMVSAVSGVQVPFLLAIGVFNLAVSAGTVAVPAPAGLGVRDGVLAVGLAPFLGPGEVILVVIMSRLWFLVTDLTFALTGHSLAAVRQSRPAPGAS